MSAHDPSPILDDRYELGARLGAGGVADVWEATDLRTGDQVAVKQLRSTLHDDGERLRREANILERLDHPGIARLRRTGVADGQPYLVLDLVDGETLTQRLVLEGPLSDEEVRDLAAQLGDALAYAHAQGVIHRDVKPSNVMLGHDGVAVLVDFGVGRLIGSASTVTRTGMVTGTIAYTSPEQVSGQPITEATDIYSLGLVLTEAATGQRVFEGTPTEVMAKRLAGDAPIPAEIPPSLSAFLVPMTFLQQGLRPSAAEVVGLARPLPPADEPTTRIATPTTVFGPAERGAARTPLVGAAAAGLGAVALAARGVGDRLVGGVDRTSAQSGRIDLETSRTHLAAATAMAALLAFGAMAADGGSTAEASDDPAPTTTAAAPTTTTTVPPPPPPVEHEDDDGEERKGRGKSHKGDDD